MIGEQYFQYNRLYILVIVTSLPVAKIQTVFGKIMLLVLGNILSIWNEITHETGRLDFSKDKKYLSNIILLTYQDQSLISQLV